MKPYPLLFEPIYKEKVWGGRSLEGLGKTLPEGVKIGESWELADLPVEIEGGRSVIANGLWQGQTLHDVLRDQHAHILGPQATQSQFPLLIKYLDARENLSVQVHPSPDYAAAHPEVHLKSEAWVILEAEPGAVIYKGIKPGVTPKQFAEHISTGKVVDDLVTIPVSVGECHYLPSGTCHALGAGIVVAEVQTPSDTTFRVYDWGRTDREIHVEEALACIDFNPVLDEPADPLPLLEADGLCTRRLVKTDFFEIDRMEVAAEAEFEVVTGGGAWIWMLQAGEGVLRSGEAGEIRVKKGDTILMPAALQDTMAVLAPGSAWLSVSPPSPYRNVIA